MVPLWSGCLQLGLSPSLSLSLSRSPSISLDTKSAMEPAIEHPPRAKNLAESGLKHLSSEYIQRPRPALTAPRIPGDALCVVDLFSFSPAHRNDVHGEIQKACWEWGQFRVVSHGVPKQLLDDVMTAGRSFFGCPKAEKQYSCDPRSAASEGYGSRMLSKDDGVFGWRD